MKKLAATVLSLFVIMPLLASQEPVERTYDQVTPAGAFTVNEVSTGVIPSESKANRNTVPGLVWNHPDGGLAWMGRSVSIGDRGTQVCSLHELNNERVQLFSGFDVDPPTPIWTDTSIHDSDPITTSSSSLEHYHVAAYWMTGAFQVNGYDSSSGTALWTWTYTAGTAAGGNVAIDRDGTIVAVAVVDASTTDIHLYFLDPATGAELFTPHYSQPFGGLRGFDLSADGSTLYIHNGGSDVNIFDVATQTVTFTATTAGSFDGHCISGDGTKFAFGGFGTVKIWEYIGGSWSSYVFSTGGGNYADEMDFSDDGSTLGFGVTQYSPSYTKCEGYMLDIATKTVVAHETRMFALRRPSAGMGATSPSAGGGTSSAPMTRCIFWRTGAAPPSRASTWMAPPSESTSPQMDKSRPRAARRSTPTCMATAVTCTATISATRTWSSGASRSSVRASPWRATAPRVGSMSLTTAPGTSPRGSRPASVRSSSISPRRTPSRTCR